MRKIAAAAVALGLLAAPSAASAAKATPGACAAARSALDGSAQVRLHGRAAGADVYACSLENGRRIRLGYDSSGGSSSVAYVRAAVAGRLVAWYRTECPRAGDPGRCYVNEFTIANVHSGKVRTRRGLTRVGEHIMEIVLKPNGSAAWVERAYVEGVGVVDTLRRRQPGGEDVLAEGGTIRGLALSEDSTLYWTQDGVPRSARVEPAGPAPAVEQPRPPCGDPGTAIAANAWLRVWRDDGVDRACSLETGRVVEFGESYSSGGGSTSLGPYALAGRLIAWDDSFCSSDDLGFSCEHHLKLVDMRTGTQRELAQAAGYVEDLVLNRKGSAAWVDSRGVRVVDSRGDRTLGPGTDLALSRGSTLYWTGPGGTPAFAPVD
jgi:hypothetical protein